MDLAGRAHIEKSPERLATASSPSESSSKHECAICLEAITQPCEAGPCGHTDFDYQCLLSWLKHTPRDAEPTCPVCRAQVAKVRQDFKDHQGLLLSWRTLVVPRPPRRTGELLPRSRRQRTRSPAPRTAAQAAQDAALQRRRDVYARDLYACHVGSNRRSASSHRELSPELFRNDAALMARARAFLQRDLQVFTFLGGDSSGPSSEAAPQRWPSSYVLIEHVVAILKSMDMQGCEGQAEDIIADWLGRRFTRHLLHELKAFLRSPYESLAEWDRHVQYRDV